MLRGMPTMLYYMTRNKMLGGLGWGPKYTITVLNHQADKGLDQVRCHGCHVYLVYGISYRRVRTAAWSAVVC